ncbi:MAG TPA: DNA methyltransferase [Terracidiphilus sp.]|jgi:16S rRNA G966 N2-methylase RsmD
MRNFKDAVKKKGSALKKSREVIRAAVVRPQSLSGKNLSILYNQPLKASRTGALYSAFPYPTKISPEAIALFIASHTNPGDTVFDGFAGSGTTGIATLLCASPTETMRDQAKKLGLKIQWGARKAVLREIGTLGSFVGQTLCNPPNPDKFRREAERILTEAEQEVGWMYEARNPDGGTGSIRYLIWSEFLECPNCGKEIALWDGCVRRRPARINSTFSCPHCSRRKNVADLRRLTETVIDDFSKEKITARVRRPVWLYGVTGKRQWSRPIEAGDESLLTRIAHAPLPSGIPLTKVPWGDLYRSGYHQGITHLHHFYTRRNLIVFATLWRLASSSPLRDALRFWLLSYNASHATIMTRVVPKKAGLDLVITSSQPGVLYVSGLPVEKNLFAGLRRKLKTIHAAFTLTYRLDRSIQVERGSCLNTDLPDQSVDYVFTDPPFGGNIPYAEVNFINEAWLGECTNPQEEVTISRVQGKDASDYRALMTRAFLEIDRVLKKDGKATVIFHSSSSEVWNALSHAYNEAGLGVEVASILDKTQGSFKQVTTKGSVKGDPVLLLGKRPPLRKSVPRAALPVIKELLEQAHTSSDRAEQTPQRLYSRFVTHFLTREQSVPLNADEFYHLVASTPLLSHARPSIE